MSVAGLRIAIDRVRPLCWLLIMLNLIWVFGCSAAIFGLSVSIRMKILLLLLVVRKLKFPLVLNYPIAFVGTSTSFRRR